MPPAPYIYEMNIIFVVLQVSVRQRMLQVPILAARQVQPHSRSLSCKALSSANQEERQSRSPSIKMNLLILALQLKNTVLPRF